jgi:hypothetical protein
MDFKPCKSIETAIKRAQKLAADGPRVAAVLHGDGMYGAVAGYLDADFGNIQQVALITPDGRVWEPKHHV